MRRLLRWVARVLALVLAAFVAVLLFGPQEPVDVTTRFETSVLGTDLDAYLALQEAGVPGITAGVEKRIAWAGQAGVPTPVAIVYLHGFSATSREISPVTENVAGALGANVYFPRMSGHGLQGAQLAKATVNEWIRDAKEALEIGRRIGDKVVVIGTSTGATYAALAAAGGEVADGYVFISPNFRLKNPAAVLLTLPLARTWVPLLVGTERKWEPSSPDQARYWTNEYPNIALVPMAAAVKAARDADYGALKAPLLAIFDVRDKVVDAAETRKVLAGWGGPVSIVNPQELPGDDPSHHVIAGDIVSPGQTGPTTVLITAWIRENFSR